MAIILRAKCLGVERKQSDGGTDARTGEVREGYDYLVAHMLDGWEARACRIDDGFGPAPVEGEEVEAVVQVRPYRRGQDAQLSVRLMHK